MCGYRVMTHHALQLWMEYYLSIYNLQAELIKVQRQLLCLHTNGTVWHTMALMKMLEKVKFLFASGLLQRRKITQGMLDVTA